MKANNKKRIERYRILYIFLIFITFITLTLIIFVRFQAVIFYSIFSLSIILILISLRNLFHLKYFDYEHSGEVLTIKYYSVFKFGEILPAVEVPKQKILTFSIEKKGKTQDLNLLIEARNGKGVKFSFRLTGFSKKQIEKIRNSLSVH